MRATSPAKRCRALARIIGACCLGFASLGILFSGSYAISVYPHYSYDPSAPYFLFAYSVLLGLSVAAYAALVYCGIQLVRARTASWKVLGMVAVAEVATIVGSGLLWNVPAVAMSVARASGIGSVGLMPQLVTLFILWGPALAWWSDRRLRRLPVQRRSKGHCPQCGYDLRGDLARGCPECNWNRAGDTPTA
ncbi:MAG: hypothetical protein L0Y44_09235 [Phycisphaerales bacterium]|nr:hypothetical protein [Phycisphaerales bacterium]MCI0630821.1 hypothetical protein [Phycisphaerales bacterium]MCI0674473.1 hypothetical protein [Phycisphaerales bacterium]